MDLHALLSSYSYLGIFVLMIANGAINVPSSQFLYVIVGYFVSTGNLTFLPAIIAGTLGNTVGNILTFLLVRKYEHPLARKILMLDEGTFTKVHTALHTTFSKRGMWWIFFGKLIPSVKAFVPIVAGLAQTPRVLTSFIFLIASLIWASIITSIGYYFGEHVTLASFGGVSLLIGAVILIVLYRIITKKIS